MKAINPKFIPVLIFSIPVGALLLQWLFLGFVIDPGWGPPTNPQWKQPRWLSQYGMSDGDVWTLPLHLAQGVALYAVIVILLGLILKNRTVTFAGLGCLIASPLLWFDFVVESF